LNHIESSDKILTGHRGKILSNIFKTVSTLLGLVQTAECPALVPNVQNGSQNMLSTVPLLSSTSRGSARSWALCPISFESVVFKLGAKTSAEHRCRAPSLDAALVYFWR
jgi:hypothetical protein